MAELRVLRRQRDALDDQIQRLEWQLRHAAPGEVMRPRFPLCRLQVPLCRLQPCVPSAWNASPRGTPNLAHNLLTACGWLAAPADAPGGVTAATCGSFSIDEAEAVEGMLANLKEQVGGNGLFALVCMVLVCMPARPALPCHPLAAGAAAPVACGMPFIAHCRALLTGLPPLQRESLRERHRALLKAHHDQFHPVWGQLMKTGYQNSRYAHQIER